MVNFEDFDCDDTQLALKDELHVQIGYAANLCCPKGVYHGEEVDLVLIGNWTEIYWPDIFKKYVPANIKFIYTPPYLMEL